MIHFAAQQKHNTIKQLYFNKIKEKYNKIKPLRGVWGALQCDGVILWGSILKGFCGVGDVVRTHSLLVSPAVSTECRRWKLQMATRTVSSLVCAPASWLYFLCKEYRHPSPAWPRQKQWELPPSEASEFLSNNL